jgi:uncharacterized BrkB/YihY/UPF0761 family membrane protein
MDTETLTRKGHGWWLFNLVVAVVFIIVGFKFGIIASLSGLLIVFLAILIGSLEPILAIVAVVAGLIAIQFLFGFQAFLGSGVMILTCLLIGGFILSYRSLDNSKRDRKHRKSLND